MSKEYKIAIDESSGEDPGYMICYKILDDKVYVDNWKILPINR